MSSLLVIIFYWCIIFCCQLLNNTVTLAGILIIPIGLFIYCPLYHLNTIGATFLYCTIGLVFDTMFTFLPIGFTVFFLLCFDVLQKCLFNTEQAASNQQRTQIEQLSNFVYIICIFLFQHSKFNISQFLLTVIISQCFIFAFSTVSYKTVKTCINTCDRFSKYTDK